MVGTDVISSGAPDHVADCMKLLTPRTKNYIQCHSSRPTLVLSDFGPDTISTERKTLMADVLKGDDPKKKKGKKKAAKKKAAKKK